MKCCNFVVAISYRGNGIKKKASLPFILKRDNFTGAKGFFNFFSPGTYQFRRNLIKSVCIDAFMDLLAKPCNKSRVCFKNYTIAIYNKRRLIGIKDSLKRVIVFFKIEVGVVIIFDIHTYAVHL